MACSSRVPCRTSGILLNELTARTAPGGNPHPLGRPSGGRPPVAQPLLDRWPCPERLVPLARGDFFATARRAAASSLRRTWAAACPADTSAGVLRRLGELLGGCCACMGTLLCPSPGDDAVARRAGGGKNAARCHGLYSVRELRTRR